jgi:hypothetical protein
MSKRKNNNFIKTANETKHSNEPRVPSLVLDDPNFRFGKSSGNNNEDAQRIGGIINYDYLKEHLTESITKKAMENLNMTKKTNKNWRNKVFNLRSQSVAKQIESRKKEEKIESEKLNHTFVKNRGESVSSKNMYKFPSAKKTHYSDFNFPMNQTFKAKLPPLSAMGEYEAIPVFEEQARS